MCLEQSEFREQFNYQAPILPDSLDSATAFFYLVNQDGRARFTAHTAFEDPTSPPDAGARESIEVRALIFWPEQERN